MSPPATQGPWVLLAEDEPLGLIEVTGSDQPWDIGRWDPTDAFARFAPLFERELALLNADDMDEWLKAYEAIHDAGLSLRSPNGELAAEWLLHIDGDEAWFRWNPGASDTS